MRCFSLILCDFFCKSNTDFLFIFHNGDLVKVSFKSFLSNAIYGTPKFSKDDKWMIRKVKPVAIPIIPMLYARNNIGNLKSLMEIDISTVGTTKEATTVIPITRRVVGLTIFDCTAAFPIIIPPTILKVCAIFDGSLNPPCII